MADPLARLKRAEKAKRRADEEVRAALLAAADAGHSYAEISRTLGVSRQAVRQLLRRTA